MREMRLKKREIQDKSILMEIIEACDVVRIGLTDSEGMFIVPVNYGYDLDDCGDGLRLTLYIHGWRERGGRRKHFLGTRLSQLRWTICMRSSPETIPAAIPMLTEALWEPAQSANWQRSRRRSTDLPGS